jgi:hypothetical protein
MLLAFAATEQLIFHAIFIGRRHVQERVATLSPYSARYSVSISSLGNAGVLGVRRLGLVASVNGIRCG